MSPRLGSPRSVALTVTVLWDLAVVGAGLRWYRNYRKRMR